MTSPSPNSFNDHVPQFPSSLKALPIWCVWRYEERAGKQTKVPYRPIQVDGGKYSPVVAQSNNQETWVSFSDACAAVCDQDEFHLGIFADGSHTFIDLDKCLGADGVIEPWALGILARTNSYAELSPSGTGLHIFVLGAVSKASKINGCECYSAARFFTVTGQHVESTPFDVNAMPGADLEELRDDIAQDQLRPYKLNKPTAAAPTTGGLIVHKPMSASERETKLERGLSGDLTEYGNDRSSAVHGVLQLLARKHAGDREAIQEEFETSQLREDWGDKWERLGEKEMDKAIERWEENGKPAWQQEDKPAVVAKPRLRIVRFADIQTKEINWLWPGKLAHGHLTTLNGDPGTKKSFISLDIAARISTGRAMPDGLPNPCPPSSVLVLTREDGLADTVKPRFLAAGGNPKKLATVALDGSDETASLKLEEQLDDLDSILDGDTRLIIFDPLIDFLKAQQNHEAEVRDALTKLKQFAEKRELCVVGINHLNKKSDLDAIHRTMGAKGFIGVARMNFLVGKDEGGNLHLSSLKNNLWADDGSLTFKLEDSVVEDGHVRLTKVGRVVWTGKSDVTADELTTPKGKTAQNRSVDWLKGYMQPTGQKKPAKEIYEAGLLAGFSEDQLKRALGKLAKHERIGMPATTVWWLPVSEAGW